MSRKPVALSRDCSETPVDLRLSGSRPGDVVVKRKPEDFARPDTGSEHFDPLDRFFDDANDEDGNCRNKFHGLRDVTWSLERRVWGGTRKHYNVLHGPLGIVPAQGKCRRIVVKLVDSVWFDRAVLFAIAVNSAVIMLDAEPSFGTGSDTQSFIAAANLFFLAAFSAEAIVKILALGLSGHAHSYLSSSWNQLDLLVVLTGFVGLHPAVANVTIIRSLRLLHPLRSVAKVEGLRVLLQAMVNSLPALWDVFLLLMFFLMIFSIGGVTLWEGSWHTRCYLDWDPFLREVGAPAPGPDRRVFSWNDTSDLEGSEQDNWAMAVSSLGVAVGQPVLIENVTRACTLGAQGLRCSEESNGVRVPQACAVHMASYREATLNFDDIPSALLLVFKVTSLDDWPEEQQRGMDTSGILAFFYFFLVTLLGAFFCMNLVLAILTTALGEEAERRRATSEKELKGQVRQQFVLKPYPVTVATCHSTFIRLCFAVFWAGKPGRGLNHKVDYRRASVAVAAFVEAGQAHADRAANGGRRITKPSLGAAAGRHAPDDKVRVVFDRIALRRCQTDVPGGWNHELEAFVGKVGTVVDVDERGWANVRFQQGSEFTISSSALIANTASLVGRNSGETLAAKTQAQGAGVTAALAIVLFAKREEPSLYHRLRAATGQVIMSPAFNRVLIGVTVINVLVLCVDHHGISDDLNDNLLLINFACNIVFIAELFIKLWGLGGRVYFGDPFNCFDCLLVLVSIPETVSGEGSALSAFRVFRIMRVLRLVRRLRTLRSILSAILRSLSSASSLCLIMLLFTFVYTVLGLQLFTKSYPSEHRSNFESLWHAALTVFVVLTGEQWSKIMKIAMGATTPAAALYFITLFWLGNYIFVNLFIAILIDTFSQETMQVRAAKAEEANDDDTCTKAWTASPETISKTIARRHSFPDSLLAVSGSSSRTSEWSPANWKPRKVSGDNFVNPFKAAVARRASSSLPHPVAELSPLTGTSLKLFSPQSKIRIACSKVVLHPHFESCVLVLIFLNVASLVLEGPWLDRQPEVRGALRWAEYGFAVVFACEAVLKIIVVGLWQQSPLPSAGGLPARKVPSVSPIDLDELRVPYLRSTWNRVDFTVVITAILGLFVPFFATFRSLRSLRLIIRNGNIKVVVSAVLQALPAIGNVVLVVSFTCLVFAVLGVQLFKGSFYSCNDPAVTLKSECTGVFDEAVSVDAFGEFIVRSNVSRSWENEGTHFDHIGAAFLTLFEVGIGDGWAEIMYLGVDSESNDEAPRRDRHPVKSIYFVCFVIAGSFFAINLFVGLLIDRFNDLKRQLDGSALLTQEQRDWVRYNKTMRRIKLKPKTITVLGCRGAVNRFVTHPWFDLAISACIVINISVMCTKHYNQSDLETGIQQNTNFFFVAVFTVEALLKLYAWRRVYFDDPWNRFDFLLVTLSVIGMFFGNESVQAFRILRICRILRLIKRAQGLQKLFTTLYFALPSLFNLSLLLLVVYLNFGVTGVELFGRVRRHGSITKWINFENMGSAVMTLYTISTTELWAEVMKDVRRKTECEGEDTCGSEWAVVFFPSFMIVGQMIALNLVITVVLENFGELESLAETRNIVRALSHFRELWLEIDSFATGQLNLDQFILVIKDVPPPLGLQNPESFWELNYVLHHMEIAIDTAGLIRYDDVVSAFLRVAFHIKMHDLKQLKQYTGQVEDSEQQRGSPFLVNQWYCAQRIQQFFRKSRARARAGGQQAADRDDRGNPPGAVAPHLFCAKRGGFGDPARRDNADGSPPTPLLAALLCPAPTNPLACRPAAHRQPGDRDNHPGCRPKDGVFELPLRSPGHSAADDLRSSDGGWARSPAAVPSGGCRDGPPGEGGGAPESPDNEYSGEAVFFAPRTEPSEGERQSHAAAVCSREALCEGEAPSVGDDDFGRPSARQHAFQNNTEHSDDERRSHAADTSRSPAVVLFTSFRNAQRTDSAAPSAAIGSVASARNVSNITQTNDNDLADGMQHTLRAMPSVSMGPVASSISLANADYADGSHDTLPSVSNGAAAFAQNPSIHALPSVPIRPVTSVYNMSRSAQPSDGADDSPMPTVTNGAVTFVQSPSNADDDGADGVQSTLRAMPSVTMRPVTSVYNMSRSAQPSDGPDDPPAMPSVANGAVTLVHNPSIADEGDAGGLQNAVRAMPSVTMRPVTSVYNLSSLAQPGGGADDSHDNLHTMFPIASPCASTAALGYDRANSAYNSLCAMPSLRPGTSLHNFSTGAQGAGDADGSHCTPRGLPCPTIEPHMSSGNLSTVAPVRVSSGNLSNLARGPDCQSLRAARGAVESSYNLSHAAHGSRADLTGDDRNSVRATLSAVAPTDSYYNSLNVARGSRVEATVGDDPAGALTAMNASSMCSLSNAARGSRMDANGDEHADGFHAMHSAIGPVASAYDLSNAARGSRMDLTGEDNSDASRTLHTTSTAVGNASRFHELRHTSCASNTALSPEQEASASPVSCLTDTASPSYTASETRPQHCSPKIPESQCSPSRASSKASPVASKAQASKLDVDSAGTVVSSDGVSSCADAAVDVGEKMEVSNTAVRGHDDENALTDAAASAKAAARPSATHLLPPPTARDGNPAPSLPYDGSGHGVASGSDCGT